MVSSLAPLSRLGPAELTQDVYDCKGPHFGPTDARVSSWGDAGPRRPGARGHQPAVSTQTETAPSDHGDGDARGHSRCACPGLPHAPGGTLSNPPSRREGGRVPGSDGRCPRCVVRLGGKWGDPARCAPDAPVLPRWRDWCAGPRPLMLGCTGDTHSARLSLQRKGFRSRTWLLAGGLRERGDPVLPSRGQDPAAGCPSVPLSCEGTPSHVTPQPRPQEGVACPHPVPSPVALLPGLAFVLVTRLVPVGGRGALGVAPRFLSLCCHWKNTGPRTWAALPQQVRLSAQGGGGR